MISTRARGLAYFHAGDATKALPDLTAAIDASGGLSITTDADVLLCRGMIHHANRSYQAAIADFTVVIQLRPGHANGYWERGKSYLALGDKVRAQRDNNTAVSIDPKIGRP